VVYKVKLKKKWKMELLKYLSKFFMPPLPTVKIPIEELAMPTAPCPAFSSSSNVHYSHLIVKTQNYTHELCDIRH